MANRFLEQVKRRRRDLPIALILLLSFGLNMTGVTWGLPHYFDWASDSVAPFSVLEAAYHHFSHGWYDMYPPVHLAILAALYAPFIGYFLLSGEVKALSTVFPFGFPDPRSTFTHLILVSRVVSVLMGVAIILLVYLTVRELFDRRSALFSALIVTLYYPLVFYAHLANVEVPYLFWAMLAIYNFLRVLKHGALKHYILFALFSTLAICTKDQAYGLFLLSPLPILWMRFAEAGQASLQQLSLMNVIFNRRHIVAAIVAVATFILAHNLIFNFPGFIGHVQLLLKQGWSRGPDLHASTLLGRLQLLRDTVSLLAWGLTPPLFGFCLVGSFYCAVRFPRYSLPLLFLAASYYLLFINVTLVLRVRHLLPLGIIIAFFGGKLLAGPMDVPEVGRFAVLQDPTGAVVSIIKLNS